MKKIIISLLAVFCATALSAQNITVSGTVYDENGEPMIGAAVFQQGNLGNGTTTDVDGNYTIKIAPEGHLTFSALGYKEQTEAVAGRKTINVTLALDTKVLDESVVIGYGVVKRSDLTGAIASISAKDIETYKTSSVMEALGGQIAGVNITMADGTPGSGYDVKIRGVGTVNGDSSPLYIVDGFEVDNIDYLANQDIQSVEVLKDASASAIYGARAANGVVLVTTKSGKEGRPQIAYNGSATYRTIAKKIQLLTPYEFVKLAVEVNPSKYGTTYYKAGEDEEGRPYKYQSAEDYIGLPGIDWQDEAFRPTWSQNHEVSIQGGNKDTRYTASFSHFDENGTFVNSGYAKNNARVKFYQRVFKWLSLDAGVNFTNSRKWGIGTSGGTLANLLRYRPTGGLNTSDYELRHNQYDPLALESGNFDSNQVNPVLQAESVDQTRTQNQWIANGSLTFTIIKGLTLKVSGTYNDNQQRNDVFYGEQSSQAYRAGGVYGSSQTIRNLRWSNSNVLTYIGKTGKHSYTAMLGHESSFVGIRSLYGQAKDFTFGDFGVDNLGAGATPTSVTTLRQETQRLSFFARGYYNYDGRYMFTATARADASSVFAAGNKWGFFPSFSFAWNMANEKWLKDVKAISNFKFRAGWGTVGNDRISNYLSLDLYTVSRYGVGQETKTTFDTKYIANHNLRWEGSQTTNIGLDLGFVDDRVKLTVDGFVKDTKDLLLAQSLAYVTGFSSQWQNVGKIRNSGVELTLNTVNVSRRQFSWTTDFNISFIKNKLMSLQDGTDYMLSRTNINSNWTSYDYIAMVGEALGNIYGYTFDGVYQMSDFNVTPSGEMILKPGLPSNPKAVPGYTKYKDINGDGKIDTNDRGVIGNGQPKFFGGLTNSFYFYGVDLSFMLQFVYGNDVYNATRMFCTQSQDERTNQYAELADRWSATNASSMVPSAMGYTKYDISSRFVEDGSFLRLKNLTIGYTLPEKWTKKFFVSKLRLYATGQILFCLSKYSGYDPEVNAFSSPLMPGCDWGSYPRSRSFTMGLEIQF